MVKQQTATLRLARPSPPYWAVRLDVAQPPVAGQFVLADFGGPLREALFPAAIDATGFTFMAPPGHPATRLLPGAALDLIGPSGRGFRVDNVQRLLLVGTVQLAPVLWPLLESAPSVALVIEGPTRARMPSSDSIPPAVELTLVTLDGSAGYLGPLEATGPAPSGMERVVPHLLDLLTWAECVCFACDAERYPALRQLILQARLHPSRDFAQALLHAAMPCGLGACDICRIPTRNGEKHVCTDGPVFDLLEIGNE